jgi:hypothetical protein
VPEQRLDGVQGRAALHLAERPAVPEPMGVDAFLDAGLRSEPLAEGAHIAVPERLAAPTRSRETARTGTHGMVNRHAAGPEDNHGGGPRVCLDLPVDLQRLRGRATGRWELLERQPAKFLR